MLEILCAVIAITVIGLTWHIWRPIAKWAAIVGGAVVLIGGVAVGIAIVKDQRRIAALKQQEVKGGPWDKYQRAKPAGRFDDLIPKPNPWDEFARAKPAPLPALPSGSVIMVPVDPATQAAAERDGFALRVFTVKVRGHDLSVTEVDLARAIVQFDPVVRIIFRAQARQL